jgi:hypothetical protein
MNHSRPSRLCLGRSQRLGKETDVVGDQVANGYHGRGWVVLLWMRLGNKQGQIHVMIELPFAFAGLNE